MKKLIKNILKEGLDFSFINDIEDEFPNEVPYVGLKYEYDGNCYKVIQVFDNSYMVKWYEGGFYNTTEKRIDSYQENLKKGFIRYCDDGNLNENDFSFIDSIDDEDFFSDGLNKALQGTNYEVRQFGGTEFCIHRINDDYPYMCNDLDNISYNMVHGYIHEQCLRDDMYIDDNNDYCEIDDILTKNKSLNENDFSFIDDLSSSEYIYPNVGDIYYSSTDTSNTYEYLVTKVDMVNDEVWLKGKFFGRELNIPFSIDSLYKHFIMGEEPLNEELDFSFIDEINVLYTSQFTKDKHNINEGRVEDMKSKYMDDPDRPLIKKIRQRDFVVLVKGDPSGNHKYLEWMIKQVISGFAINMDPYYVLYNVTYFHNNPQKFEKKDINQYSSAMELEKYVKEAKEKLSKGEERDIIRKETKHLGKSEGWELIKPLTHRSSCKYGAGTKWCTTTRDNDNHFNQYQRPDEGSGLYYFINHTDKNTATVDVGPSESERVDMLQDMAETADYRMAEWVIKMLIDGEYGYIDDWFDSEDLISSISDFKRNIEYFKSQEFSIVNILNRSGFGQSVLYYIRNQFTPEESIEQYNGMVMHNDISNGTLTPWEGQYGVVKISKLAVLIPESGDTVAFDEMDTEIPLENIDHILPDELLHNMWQDFDESINDWDN